MGRVNMTTDIARVGQTRSSTWANRRLVNSLLLSQEDIELLNSFRPRCVKCNRLVDVFGWTRAIGQGSIKFRVECHGAVEETAVSFDMLPALMQGGVHGGEAFREPDQIQGH